MSIFVSRRSDIEVVLKALEQYEMSRDQDNGKRFSALRLSVALPGPFGFTDGRPHSHVWFEFDLLLEKNGRKYRSSGPDLALVAVFLECRAEMCRGYIFPRILYRLYVLLL